MKIIYWILFVIILYPSKLFSQEYSYEIGGHISSEHYFGDIARKGFITPWSVGAGLDFRYNKDFRLSLSSAISIEGVKGDSKWSDNIFPNNKKAKFDRKIIDISFLGEYNFYNYSDKYRYLDTERMSPFIGFGGGAFVGKANNIQLMPYIQFAFGLKYKIVNRLNLIVSYNIKYTPIDNLDVTNKDQDWLGNNPLGVKSIFPKGGDGLGLLSFSLTWDIGLKREYNCH